MAGGSTGELSSRSPSCSPCSDPFCDAGNELEDDEAAATALIATLWKFDVAGSGGKIIPGGCSVAV